jgi:hypothetical protein
MITFLISAFSILVILKFLIPSEIGLANNSSANDVPKNFIHEKSNITLKSSARDCFDICLAITLDDNTVQNSFSAIVFIIVNHHN